MEFNKTIDILILEDLLEENHVTAHDCSCKWGEDVVRCWEWLEKFRKQGLCRSQEGHIKPGVVGINHKKRVIYVGFKAGIRRALATRRSGPHA